MTTNQRSATTGVAPPPPAPGSAAALLSVAVQHHQAGQLREADALYRQILAKEPNHPDTLHLLGVLHIQVGRFDDAIKLIRRAITINGKVARFHNHIAEAYRATGRLDKAVEHCRRAIAIEPGSPDAHAGLGNALQAQGLFAEAAAQYREALAAKPDYAEAHTNLGMALLQQGAPEAAVAQCEQAVKLSPDLPEARVNLGIALQASDDVKGAVAQFRAALTRRPNYVAALANLGSALIAAGELDEALVCCERALVMASGRPAPAEASATPLQAIENARNPKRALRGVEEQCLLTLVRGNCWRNPVAQWGALADAALRQDALSAVARFELLVRKAIQQWMALDFSGLAKTLEQGTLVSGLIGPSNLKDVRHSRAYMGYLGKLLAHATSQPEAYANPGNAPPLAVVGNSHCLSLNGVPIRLGDATYKGQGHLVMGCKAWHLATADVTPYQWLLRRILADLPAGSPVLCMFGEIDCRLDEGILPHFKKVGGDLDAQIESLVGRFARHVAEWAAPRQLRLHFIGVPAPHLDAVAVLRGAIAPDDQELLVRIVQTFNQCLERAVAAEGHRYVDVYRLSAGPDGKASGQYHLDEAHLRPDALPALPA